MELPYILLIVLLGLALVGVISFVLQSAWGSPSAGATRPVKAVKAEPVVAAGAEVAVQLPVQQEKAVAQPGAPDVFTDDSTEGSQGEAAVSPERGGAPDNGNRRVPELPAWPESTWASCMDCDSLGSAFLVVVGLVLDVSRRKNTVKLQAKWTFDGAADGASGAWSASAERVVVKLSPVQLGQLAAAGGISVGIPVRFIVSPVQHGGKTSPHTLFAADVWRPTSATSSDGSSDGTASLDGGSAEDGVNGAVGVIQEGSVAGSEPGAAEQATTQAAVRPGKDAGSSTELMELAAASSEDGSVASAAALQQSGGEGVEREASPELVAPGRSAGPSPALRCTSDAGPARLSGVSTGTPPRAPTPARAEASPTPPAPAAQEEEQEAPAALAALSGLAFTGSPGETLLGGLGASTSLGGWGGLTTTPSLSGGNDVLPVGLMAPVSQPLAELLAGSTPPQAPAQPLADTSPAGANRQVSDLSLDVPIPSGLSASFSGFLGGGEGMLGLGASPSAATSNLLLTGLGGGFGASLGAVTLPGLMSPTDRAPQDRAPSPPPGPGREQAQDHDEETEEEEAEEGEDAAVEEEEEEEVAVPASELPEAHTPVMDAVELEEEAASVACDSDSDAGEGLVGALGSEWGMDSTAQPPALPVPAPAAVRTASTLSRFSSGQDGSEEGGSGAGSVASGPGRTMDVNAAPFQGDLELGPGHAAHVAAFVASSTPAVDPAQTTANAAAAAAALVAAAARLRKGREGEGLPARTNIAAGLIGGGFDVEGGVPPPYALEGGYMPPYGAPGGAFAPPGHYLPPRHMGPPGAFPGRAHTAPSLSPSGAMEGPPGSQLRRTDFHAPRATGMPARVHSALSTPTVVWSSDGSSGSGSYEEDVVLVGPGATPLAPPPAARVATASTGTYRASPSAWSSGSSVEDVIIVRPPGGSAVLVPAAPSPAGDATSPAQGEEGEASAAEAFPVAQGVACDGDASTVCSADASVGAGTVSTTGSSKASRRRKRRALRLAELRAKEAEEGGDEGGSEGGSAPPQPLPTKAAPAPAPALLAPAPKPTADQDTEAVPVPAAAPEAVAQEAPKEPDSSPADAQASGAGGCGGEGEEGDPTAPPPAGMSKKAARNKEYWKRRKALAKAAKARKD